MFGSISKLLTPLLLLLLLSAQYTWANDAQSVKTIRIAMGNFEPYFIENTKSGIFTELINAVFSKMPDYKPLYLFGYSNHRAWHDFEKNKIDAVSNLIDSVKLTACRSDRFFRFRDVVISKASSQFTIRRVSDLAGKRIVTFQGAKGFLGDEFANTVKPENYQEIAEQNWQAKVLYTDNADLSIGDMFTFLHSIKSMKKINAKASDFVFHDLFPPIYSRMGFHDKVLCERFNQAFKIIRNSGEYEAIYDKYLRSFDYYKN